MTRTEHLLACLMEECAEVQQEIGKIFRFGLKDAKFVVDGVDHEPNNVRLQQEIIDVITIIEMLADEGVEVLPLFNRMARDDNAGFEELMQKKRDKVEKYILYAQDKGTVEK
jgi:NTP pyrophosphatase (non-canonical NTP hydrolase)